jgi:diacylglycerol kinase (ATP)
MEKPSFLRSFGCAMEGLLYVLRTQRNMRIHFLFALMVLLLGIFLNLDAVELMVLCFSIALVLIAEMLNTGIEHTMDMISETYHPIARIVKDVGAGAVLLSAINAVIVGYIIFINRFAGVLAGHIEVGAARIKASHWYLSFICLVIVILISMITKTYFHKGPQIRGGMPSLHSAVAFSLWTGIWWTMSTIDISPQIVVFVVVLSFILAALVVQGRISSGIHSLGETALGAVLGVVVTVFILRILAY